MRIAILLFAIFMIGAMAESYAKKPAEITWHAADTELETAEENLAHAAGRAVDINEVNKMPVSLSVDPSVSEEKREAVRKLLRNMEEWARGKPDIELFVSPIGGFRRDQNTRKIIREATQAELDAHWDHVHITTVE